MIRTGKGSNDSWELRCQYDYRFASFVIHASNNGATSPAFHLRLANVINRIPPHELQACLDEATLPPPSTDADIEPVRNRVLEETSFASKVVLDIGGYDGFAARIALDKGATRAICLDNHQYESYGWKEKKLEGVEYIEADFMYYLLPENDRIIVGDYTLGHKCPPHLPRPDVIIFYNVLYHLKHPWAALGRLRELIKPDGEMLLCTLFRYHDGAWMYVYEPRECNPEDETVYFGPSMKAIERLLAATGWSFKLEGWAADRVVYRCWPVADWCRKHEDT